MKVVKNPAGDCAQNPHLSAIRLPTFHPYDALLNRFPNHDFLFSPAAGRWRTFGEPAFPLEAPSLIGTRGMEFSFRGTGGGP